MKTFHTPLVKKVSLYAGVTLAALLLVFGLVAVFSSKAQAATTPGGDLHGNAWSSTIGWISMNCNEGGVSGSSVCFVSPYKVSVDNTTGTFSGYAWSSNVGWISFNASEVRTYCSAGPTMASDGTVSGFAWMMSGTPGAGADGCISLHSFGGGAAYGVSVAPTTGIFSGDGWGSTVIGWVSFAGVTMTASPLDPAVSLQIRDASTGLGVSTLSVPAGSGSLSSNLFWTSANVSSCVADVTPATLTSTTDWSSAVPTSSVGHLVSYPVTSPVTYTYKITCSPTNPTFAAISSSVTIIVGSSSTTPSLNFFVDGSIAPSVDAGTPLAFTWNTNLLTSCTGSSIPPTTWSGSKASANGSHGDSLSSGISAQTTFTMTCNPVGGGAPLVASVPVSINPIACTITPGTSTDFFDPGTPLPGVSPTNFGILWSGLGTIPGIPTTMTMSVSGSSIATGMTPVTIGTRTGISQVSFTGSMPSSIETMTVKARGTLPGGRPISCTGIYTVAPTGTTGVGGHHHPPWIEF